MAKKQKNDELTQKEEEERRAKIRFKKPLWKTTRRI